MHLRTILYFLVFPLTVYSLDSFDFNRFLKKNKVLQARILYLLLCLGISFLVVNFFMDFYSSAFYQF